MKTKFNWRLGVTALGVSCVTVVSAVGADSPYHLLGEIPVGWPGSYDYLAVDASARRKGAT